VGLLFLLFTRLRKIPFVFTEHWSGYLPASGDYKGFARKLLTRRLVKRASAVTTVSENLKNAMLAHQLVGRYHVVPNVVDTELFRLPVDRKPGAKKRILHVSGLVPVKNIPGILRVTKRLVERRDDFELIIVGDSRYRESHERLAVDLGIDNKVVHFLGGKGAAEVAGYMRDSDFLLLFSNYENSPCVIVEAMASGLPVIATDVGGIPELVNEKNGILVPPKDEEELLRALISMMDNYDKYDRKYIRDEAVKRFSYETIGQQFCNIYQRIKV
jgi:glycogen(starch) synthase